PYPGNEMDLRWLAGDCAGTLCRGARIDHWPGRPNRGLATDRDGISISGHADRQKHCVQGGWDPRWGFDRQLVPERGNPELQWTGMQIVQFLGLGGQPPKGDHHLLRTYAPGKANMGQEKLNAMKQIEVLFLILLSLSCQEGKKAQPVPEASLEPQAVSKVLSPNNPVIHEVFTADPAALVYRDTVYLYVGQDQAPND